MRAHSKKRMSLGLALGLLSLACAACWYAPANNDKSGAAAAPAPATPEEETAAAKAALGSDAEVLVFGPLGGEGSRQVVAINRIPGAAWTAAATGTPVTGTAVSRVSILSKENGSWREVLRCDEHLKNPSGYLHGTPAMGVAGWHLEIEQQTDRGRVLHFTPLAPPAAVKSGAIAVAWNPKAKRYQSLDRSGREFQGESSALEIGQSRLK
ncbi:MAG TPA: hypothetical protein VGR03_06695 [Candidatus Acidoferrum sp.]|nr:hypothetical protein [Candidatus Acidoferrum sp.]